MATKLNLITGIAALALAFGAGPAFAQYGGTGNTSGSTNHQESSKTASTTDKTSADETFAKKAAAGGMAEVKLGQLAEERGSSTEVKNFGRRMVQDHSKANDELKNAASRENLSLPSDMEKSDQATYDRLSKLSGEAFDRAYARDMVRDHTKDIADFQKEAKDGKNEAIKNFAAQTVPVLQSHLDQARQMEQAVNRETNSGAGENGGNRENNRNNGSGTTYPNNNRTAPPPAR